MNGASIAKIVFRLVFIACFLGLSSAGATTAVDPATTGPFTANAKEYKLPASLDSEVTSAINTELWARVFYPSGTNVPTLLPIVIMLHGEHGTCGHLDSTGKWYIDDRADYTTTGACPTGYRPTPNHWGYDYIGSLLATNGYIVVSINTNRGINQAPEVAAENDPGNIQRRGRMILRHLQALGGWNANGGTPASVGFEFKGRLDFSRITLMGHSRGAEAIASAMLLFQQNGSPWPARLPANTKFLGLAAIAPSDFQTSANPASTYGRPYGVLLPMCDGDVVRLVGMRFYDTAVGFALDGPGNFKSAFATGGADHDGYNTEWLTQDSFDFVNDVANKQDCPGQTKLFPSLGTSASQEQLGRRFVMAIVRAVTENKNFGQLLNPAYALPSAIASIAPIDRSYFPGQSTNAATRLVQFADNGKCAAELFTTAGTVGSCIRAPEHDQLLTWAARVRWGAPAGSTPTHSNFAQFVVNGGQPFDLSKSQTLEFRVGPDCVLVQAQSGTQTDYGCGGPSLQGFGAKGSQGAYVLLADKNGNYSRYIWLGNYTTMRQAVGIDESPINGATLINPLYHALMSSVRVPIADFKAAAPFDMTQVANIWVFLGYQNSSGGLFFGDVIATNSPVTAGITQNEAPTGSPPLPPSEREVKPAYVETAADAVSARAVASPRRSTYGNSLVSTRILDWPSANPNGPARSRSMIEFTFKTPKPMIEGASGFYISLGGSIVEARHTGSEQNGGWITRLAIPGEAVGATPAGSELAVISGGSRWDFGQFR